MSEFSEELISNALIQALASSTVARQSYVQIVLIWYLPEELYGQRGSAGFGPQAWKTGVESWPWFVVCLSSRTLACVQLLT